MKGEAANYEITNEQIEKYGLQVSATDSEKGIADFWLNVVKNSKYFICNEKDEEVLKHLIDVRLILDDPYPLNFKAEFEFSANQFFSESVLSKSYIYDEKTGEIEKMTGSQITWSSQEKNPRVKVVNKKIKKGKKVEIKKTEKIIPSFFDIFADVPKEEMFADEAEFLRDDMFPNCFEYFLNIINEDEDEYAEDDEESEDDDDEDGSEGGKKKKPAKKAENKESQEKCKNQ